MPPRSNKYISSWENHYCDDDDLKSYILHAIYIYAPTRTILRVYRVCILKKTGIPIPHMFC